MDFDELKQAFPDLSRNKILVGGDVLEHLTGMDVSVLHFGPYPFDEPSIGDAILSNVYAADDPDDKRLKKHFGSFCWDFSVASNKPISDLADMNGFLDLLVPPGYKVLKKDPFRLYGHSRYPSWYSCIAGGELYISKEVARVSMQRTVKISDKNLARLVGADDEIFVYSETDEPVHKSFRVFAHPCAEFARERDLYSADGCQGPQLDIHTGQYLTKSYDKYSLAGPIEKLVRILLPGKV